MRFLIGTLAWLCAGAISVAAADPPSSTASPAATPAPAEAPAAASSPAATPAQDTKSAAAAGAKGTVVVQGTAEQDPLEKHFLAEGYRIEMHNGEKLFCRREEKIGSRLGGQMSCGTAEQLNQTEQEAKAAYQRGQSQQTNPKGN
jgi:hypothetical protein